MKKYFSKTLDHHNSRLLFQSHSHHAWPDVAFTAMHNYENLVMNKLDLKWDDIFSQVIPLAQRHVLTLLNLPSFFEVSFGSNTQELLVRCLSALATSEKILNVVTTSFEYHSARRLFQNLLHHHCIKLEVIQEKEKDIINSLEKYLTQSKTPVDVCFISQSYFLTGYTNSEEELLHLAESFPQTHFIIDCYHSFAARSLDFSRAKNNISLLGGGYKYAMSGEGVCFIATHPEACFHEPILNGWMAEFSSLEKSSVASDPLIKTHGFWRFMGATFDPAGLYRFTAVWDHWNKEQISPREIRKHSLNMQLIFTKNISSDVKDALCLFPSNYQGNFLSLMIANEKNLQKLIYRLNCENVLCDGRGYYLRFGFGPYIDEHDVRKLVNILNDLKEDLLLKD